MTVRRVLLVGALVAGIFVTALLAGCGSSSEQPVGVGRGTDDYKKSPCACVELPQRPLEATPEFWRDVVGALG